MDFFLPEERISIPSSFKKNHPGTTRHQRIVTGRNCCWHVWPPTGKFPYCICRGVQVLNAAFGGSLYQDIHSQMEGTRIKHSQQLDRSFASHTIEIEPGSLLEKIMGCSHVAVNSFHHQAVREAAPGFRVSARAKDGVIEAIESTEGKSILGVQWHPECFILNGDESMIHCSTG